MTNLYATHVLPWLVEKACRSTSILAQRREWIARARGEVLEVGVGSGLNLELYDRDRVARVTGIDPSAPLLARAGARAERSNVPTELREADACRLPFAAEAFDTVVLTYTLCSIDDPHAALAEIARVMRRDARLIFVEHGRAPERRYRWLQTAITPLWRRLGGGCRLDRDPVALLGASGFTCEELELGRLDGTPLTNYAFRGVASR